MLLLFSIKEEDAIWSAKVLILFQLCKKSKEICIKKYVFSLL